MTVDGSGAVWRDDEDRGDSGMTVDGSGAVWRDVEDRGDSGMTSDDGWVKGTSGVRGKTCDIGKRGDNAGAKMTGIGLNFDVINDVGDFGETAVDDEQTGESGCSGMLSDGCGDDMTGDSGIVVRDFGNLRGDIFR